MTTRDAIKSAILDLLEKRGSDKTICPSEVARALQPGDWRGLMDLVRDVADELVQAQLVEVTQRGAVLGSATTARGAIRLRTRMDTDARRSAACTDSRYTFAIVGMGPRGSHALECLVEVLDGSPQANDVAILVFDDSPDLGAGPVWSPEQGDSNWVNLNERLLELEPRDARTFSGAALPAFPSYHQWAELDVSSSHPDAAQSDATQPDTYPPRAKVGRYLCARAESILRPLLDANVVTLVSTRVRHVERADERWSLFDADGRGWLADDVLLTIGHQPTRLDEQIAEWSDAIGSRAALFTQPYPVSPITDHALAQDGDLTVAVRGYGLAMMDVVRALAETFGTFRGDASGLIYEPRGANDLRLVPFSLDGLPMSPKPLTPALDAPFAPSEAELKELSSVLSDRRRQEQASGAALLVDAITPIAARVFLALDNGVAGAPTNRPDVEALIRLWLEDSDAKHASFVARDTPPVEALERYASMATGVSAVSLDYCVGQVWRHCHPTIYESLSYSALSDEAVAATIGLDERIKRFSFGPPVESLQQLVALARAQVLVLDFVDDPSIECGEHGWTLSSGDQGVTAVAMVDSVLDSPTLESVVAPVVTGLIEDSVIRPVHDKLGIETRQDGTVVSGAADAPQSLSVLGRLAKGTLVGVDAILECRGDRPRAWAQAAYERLQSSAVTQASA